MLSHMIWLFSYTITGTVYFINPPCVSLHASSIIWFFSSSTFTFNKFLIKYVNVHENRTKKCSLLFDEQTLRNSFMHFDTIILLFWRQHTSCANFYACLLIICKIINLDTRQSYTKIIVDNIKHNKISIYSIRMRSFYRKWIHFNDEHLLSVCACRFLRRAKKNCTL